MLKNPIAQLYKLPKTVFTTQDLILAWQENNLDNIKSKTNYYVAKGDLIRLRNGVFACDENYDRKELATSLYKPSYISFETVLREAGFIFQHYETIFVASRFSFEREVDQNKFVFRKLKDEVLFNSQGIINRDNFAIATPERAFLDMLYLFPEYHFDNLASIDWKQCQSLVKIYNNQSLVNRFNQYKKEYAQ